MTMNAIWNVKETPRVTEAPVRKLLPRIVESLAEELGALLSEMMVAIEAAAARVDANRPSAKTAPVWAPSLRLMSATVCIEYWQLSAIRTTASRAVERSETALVGAWWRRTVMAMWILKMAVVANKANGPEMARRRRIMVPVMLQAPRCAACT
jgi:hypothetical protein